MGSRALRIAQVAPPLERVPPAKYGGTERVIHELVLELLRRGHDVTLFASGDSDEPGRHIATVPRALRPEGFGGDPLPYFVATELEVLRHAREFDVIHSHLEWSSLTLAAASPVPVVSTFHGRLDWPFAADMLRDATGIVAISQSQASAHPDAHWEGVVHNGLTLRDAPFERRRGDQLCFIGRIEPEKGVLDAMEIARRAGRVLKLAAKIGTTPDQQAYYNDVFLPALEEAGSSVEFLGEVDPETRDQLLAESYACLIPATWPEPFGLVTIEALACGTPVIARRAGALPEVIRDGIDGFFGDDPAHMAFLLERVETLDRRAIRRSAIERFSPARMVDKYEGIYERRMAAFGSERSIASGRSLAERRLLRNASVEDAAEEEARPTRHPATTSLLDRGVSQAKGPGRLSLRLGTGDAEEAAAIDAAIDSEDAPAARPAG